MHISLDEKYCESTQHRPSHLLRNQGAEDTSGHVTEKVGT